MSFVSSPTSSAMSTTATAASTAVATISTTTTTTTTSTSTTMITIDVASDLHAEFPDHQSPLYIPHPERDLFLAGDIGLIENGSFIRAIQLAASYYRHVYVILGNHEYYSVNRRTVDELETMARDQIKSTVSNATLLQREAATTADGILVLGCTLWSNIDPAAAQLVYRSLTDYRRIWVPCSEDDERAFPAISSDSTSGARRMMEIEDGMEWFERDSKWLQSSLQNCNRQKRAIVFTHHGPTLAVNPPQYKNSPITSAFVSELYMDGSKIFVSISGHTHGRVQAKASLAGCRLEGVGGNGPQGGAGNGEEIADTSSSGGSSSEVDTTEEEYMCIAHCQGYPGELAATFSPLSICLQQGT